MPKTFNAGPNYGTFPRKKLIQECGTLRDALHQLAKEATAIHRQLHNVKPPTTNCVLCDPPNESALLSLEN